MIRFAKRLLRARLRLGSLAGAVLLAPALVTALVGAQPVAAQAVVQPLPDPAEARLAEAKQLLARNPRSLEALLSASDAAMRLGDLPGALGFLSTAEGVAPADGRVKAGLASLMLRHNHPLEALRLFAAAERLGAPAAAHAAELGLAHDLLGDNMAAQRFYTQALDQGEGDEVRHRLALSQAIAGNRAASERTLLPLLQRRDLAAYRARAFALAIMGQEDDAVAIAETMLPQRLSIRLAPYLRYMRRLTRAQQAAAVHVGIFPRSDQIGRDSPEIAALAGVAPSAASIGASPGADARLEPTGPVMGSAAPRVAPTPRIDNLPPAGGRLETRAGLSEAFADLGAAGATVSAPVARPGAVDITGFQPPREAPAPPAAATHPARHWVQLATGRDRAALGFDWRRIRREAGGLLDGMQPHLAAWGANSRLLAGPFNQQEAQALVTALAGRSVETFRFSSTAGQEVAPLR